MTDKPKKLTVKRTVLQIIKENEALKDALREAVDFINKTYKGNIDNLGKEKLVKRLEELLK